MELDAIRAEIDGLDRRILELFVRRMDCAKRVAAYKIENGLPVLNARRENEILGKIGDAAGEYGFAAKMVFSTLMEASRALQHDLLGSGAQLRAALGSAAPVMPDRPKIACQGVPGAYSGQAALGLYPGGEVRFYGRFEDVFRAVEKDEADFGVVPVENSTAGSVAEVYDLMLRYRFYIARGINLGISHCLLGRPGAGIPDIKTVYSHPQGLLQCADFLKAHGMEPVSCSNTAAAAEKVARMGEPSAGAVASEEAARRYGLEVLKKGIQNSGTYSTRFIAASKRLYIAPDADRISLAFSLPHVTGSLYRALARFSVVGLNLTKIESRPVSGRDFEYLFYLDFIGNLRDEKTVGLLCALSDELPDFTFLGNYPQLERAGARTRETE